MNDAGSSEEVVPEELGQHLLTTADSPNQGTIEQDADCIAHIDPGRPELDSFRCYRLRDGLFFLKPDGPGPKGLA
jgi:hypothetical protein